MFGSAVLDTAIGMLLLFFVTSTICSNIYTVIARILNARGKLLRESLDKLLGPEFAEMLMNHPLIKENYVRRNFLTGKMEYQTEPAYIAPEVFARIVLEYLEKASFSSDPLKVLPSDISYPILYFIEEVQKQRKSVEELLGEIENWFNERMDGLTRIFKEQAQWFLGGIAILVVLGFNINAISIASSLWKAPTLRDALVETAQVQITVQEANAGLSPDGEEGEIKGPVQIFEEDLKPLGLPLGWTSQELDALGIFPSSLAYIDDPSREVSNTFTSLLGWAITVGTAMFGAPFWFDLLRNLVTLSGKK